MSHGYAAVRPRFLDGLTHQIRDIVDSLPRAAEEGDPEKYADADYKHGHCCNSQNNGQTTAAPIPPVRIVVVVHLVLKGNRTAFAGLRCGTGIGLLRRGPAGMGRLGTHGVRRVGAQNLSGFVAVGDKQIGGRIVEIDAGILAELLQIHQHGVCRYIALVDIRGHSFHGDGLQSLWDLWVDLPWGERNGVDVLDGHRHRGLPLIGQAASDHLIEYHTGGVDIAAGVDMAAAGLLRRDIVY